MKKLIKKLLILTVCTVMVVTAMPLTGIDLSDIFTFASAYSGALSKQNDKISGGFQYRKNGNEISIVKYLGSDSEVVIPAYIDGLPVTSLESYSFCPYVAEDENYEYVNNKNCQNIESIYIPETVRYINYKSFSGCSMLSSVVFAEGTEIIGPYVFEQCVSLNRIDFPSTLVGIEQYPFKASNVSEITFKKNDAIEEFYIMENAFAYSKIQKLTFPSDNVYMFSGAFLNSIVKEVVFEGTVTSFGDRVFPVNNNYVKKVVFKSDFPETVVRNLVLDYGYFFHEIDGYVYFDKTALMGSTSKVEGDFYYSLNDDNSVTIVKYAGNDEEVIVPETIDSRAVTRIGKSSFMNCTFVPDDKTTKSGIKKVTLPSTVKYIEDFAFAKNGLLNTVVLPESLEYIGISAFQGNDMLKFFETTSSVKYVGNFAFSGCTALPYIELNSAEYIGTSAFDGCTRLAAVTLSEHMTDIGAYAFYNCPFTSIVIPEGITEIKPYTFSACASLKTVTLPQSIKKIDKYAFSGTTNLITVSNTERVNELGEYAFYQSGIDNFDFSGMTNPIPKRCFKESGIKSVTLPAAVLSVGEGAFESCAELEYVEICDGVKELGSFIFKNTTALQKAIIPGSVENIPVWIFYGSGLTELELGNGIKTIRFQAFSACKNLAEVTIPESVELIETYSFNGTDSLKVLNYNAINCKILDDDGHYDSVSPFGDNAIMEINIGNKVEYLPLYLMKNSEITSLTIPSNVKRINDTFNGSTKLKTLFFENGVEEILGGFTACSGLTEITIPESVTKLYANSFKGCNKVETIYFNAKRCTVYGTQKVESDVNYGLRGESAFGYLPNLTNIILGDKVQLIPDYLYSMLDFIQEINIPESVTDIGEYAFYGCTGLTTITLPSKLESIGNNAFDSCAELVSINFPDTLRLIGNKALRFCMKLESVSLPDSVVSIGEAVFAYCYGLKSVTLSSNINSIPTYAFLECDTLEEIYIPDSVYTVEERAFYCCRALIKARMSPNVTYISDGAFYCCDALTEFTWDAVAKLIGKHAFSECTSLTEFNFVGIEKLYDTSFLGSGVTVVQLGEAQNEQNAALKEIEAQSFMECENLSTLGIGGNVSTVKSQAFADCTNLETAVIADSVTEIADDAFDGCDKLTIYCSENSYAHSYAQTQGIKVSTFVIAPIPNQTYTGFEIKPEISVSASGDKLAENVDFGVTYANNINVGNADVTVKGKGDFRMFASRANFTIVTKNISHAVIEPIVAQDYTGAEVKPSITLTDGGHILRNGVDYTVSYKDNVKEGTATVIIKGIGNYSGTTSAEFEIEELDPIEIVLNAIASFFASIWATVKAFFAQFKIL